MRVRPGANLRGTMSTPNAEGAVAPVGLNAAQQREATGQRLGGVDDLGAERMPGFPTREAMIEIWEKASGRRVRETIDYWEIFGLLRFCAIMIKLGDRLVRAGIVPAAAEMWRENGTTQSLERLLAHQGA